MQQDHIWYPFTQAKTASSPCEIVKAKGVELTTADGNTLIDCVSSWWVNVHGHAHPEIAKAIFEQASTLEHVILADYTHAPAKKIAQNLIEKTHNQFSKCFFSDNGSTSIEVAIKMAYQYWQNRAMPNRNKFIAFDGAYHGDTFGAMSMGQYSGFFDPFKPLLFSVSNVPYPHTWLNDKNIEQKEHEALKALQRLLEKHPTDFAAIILEPLVQGAGGMRMVRPQFIAQCVNLVRQYGVLVIFDEVMTGFGRTGSMFAFEQCDVVPDLLCLSKGLTGGFVPMSVTLATQSIYQAFWDDGIEKAFLHGHSYTANPIGCRAALASMALFEQENTLQKIANIHEIYQQQAKVFAQYKNVTNIRICGSIFALDLNVTDAGYSSSIAKQLKREAKEQGLLLRPLGNVLYLIPPYCITIEQLEQVFNTIQAFTFFLK